jgi:hypothetical protein
MEEIEEVEPEKEKESAVEIWHGNYKNKTEHLPERKRQCLDLLRQPIEDAIKKVLKGVTFKSPMNVEALMEALTYEELIFFMPKVIDMCGTVQKKVNTILDKFSKQGS